MLICVDPGHGGHDPGAIGRKPYQYLEKDFNLDLAFQLPPFLDDDDQIITTRGVDQFVDLNQRAEFANRAGSDIFVSIHANAAATEGTEGFEIYCFPGSYRGESLALSVLKSLVEAMPGHKNRGVKEANWAVLRLTLMPAILVECEFITNPKQLVFLSSHENQKLIAKAIMTGIRSYKGDLKNG